MTATEADDAITCVSCGGQTSAATFVLIAEAPGFGWLGACCGGGDA